MKIFLVWSGARSFEIAKSLNDWLPRVIQALKPFFSNDLEKGAKWAGEIDAALEGTNFGIVCLTPDNLKNSWVLYEAGALSKTKDARVCTYLNGLRSTDVEQPLGGFQHTLSTKEDTLQLLKTINKCLSDSGGEPLSNEVLEDNFELFWPQLEKKLEAAMKVGEGAPRPAHRDQGKMLEEILELLRSQQRGNQFVPRVRRAQTGRENIIRMEFQIPSVVKTDTGGERLAEDISSIYTEALCTFGAEVSQETIEDGIRVVSSFAHPVSKELLNTAINMAYDAAFWTPEERKIIYL